VSTDRKAQSPLERRLSRWTAFALGFGILIHETAIADAPRAELVAAAIALIGVPTFSRNSS